MKKAILSAPRGKSRFAIVPKSLLLGLASSVVLSSLFSACLKDAASISGVAYKGSFSAPIASTKVVVGSLLKDIKDGTVTLDKGNATNPVKIIYRKDNLATISADEILNSVTKNLSLNETKFQNIGEITVGDKNTQAAQTFNEMLGSFNPATATFLRTQDGKNAVIAPFVENINKTSVLEPSKDYEYMEIKEGRIEIKIVNNFFIDLKDLKLILRDEGNSQNLGDFTFPAIAAGATETRTIDLAGKRISNRLAYTLPTLASAGSNGQAVKVDLASALLVQVNTLGLKISGGSVLVPETKLDKKQIEVNVKLDGDKQITRLDMKAGVMKYTITSGIAQAFDINLAFPSILKDGKALSSVISVPASAKDFTGTIDLANTQMLLDKVAGQAYNKLNIEYGVTMKASDKLLKFSSADQIKLDFAMSQFKITLAQGYFGAINQNISQGLLNLGLDFALFEKESSPFFFDDPVMTLKVKNSIGVPLNADFQIVGENGTLKETLKANLNFPAPTKIGDIATGDLKLNKANSNIVKLLGILPKKITYAGAGKVNPDGFKQGVTNFITETGKMEIGAEFELPFKFSAENLVLRDTFALTLPKELENIASATMQVTYKNGMPFDTRMNLYAVSAAGVKQLVITDLAIPSATVDANGKATAAGTGNLAINLDNAKWTSLRTAKKLMMEASVKTYKDGKTPVALYSDYALELGFGVQANVDVIRDFGK